MDENQLLAGYIDSIKQASGELQRNITIMEICGGHTNIILKYGIRDMLPKNIKLISGPGCPVCVSSQRDIDCIIELANKGVPIATYGDMMKVPGSRNSLDDIRAKGGKIFEVYSTTEVVKLKEKYPEVVFFGVGFETTSPMTAYLLENDICVYSVHKIIPPALKILAKGDLRIDGFINPGHVSTIIGVKPYRQINMPQVISGFTAERVMRAISILVELIKNNKNIVVNGYPEAVNEEGNINAQKLLDKHFYICDSEWRGLGFLPMSGLEVRDESLNAKVKYKEIIESVPVPKKTACKCGSVLKGLIEPTECPIYRKSCTPENPQGACMVSAEGSCSIYFNYGR